jgi:probable phosphoglycerate mutase
MTVELWLVRHGETDWNAEGRMQGHMDIPLNEVGRNQARLLANELQGLHVDALYSSDLKRAWQTAEILGKQLGLEVWPDTRLREIDQGEWSGLSIEEIRSSYSEGRNPIKLDPIHGRPPGGESSIEVAQRVWALADEIASGFAGKRVLLVSHGFALATLIAAASAIPFRDVRKLIPQNTALIKIDWTPGQRAPI